MCVEEPCVRSGVTEAKGKGRKESKAKKLLFDDDHWDGDDIGDESWDGEAEKELSDNHLIDLDIEWFEEEEEFYDDAADDEEWFRKNSECIRSEVNGSLRGLDEEGEDRDEENDIRFKIDENLNSVEVRIQEEVEGDSDELRRLNGDSDDDEDLGCTWFNAEVQSHHSMW